jgi:hypothetical protein
VIERREGFNEEFFGCLRLLETPAIRHRLATASLVKGIDDIHVQLLQKLQSSDTDFRIKRIDVTRDHQGDLHGCSLSEREDQVSVTGCSAHDLSFRRPRKNGPSEFA